MERMDSDGDALISFAEFTAFLQQMGLHGCYAEVSTFIEEGVARRAAVRQLTDEQTAALFAAIDIDGSGTIELDELMAFGRAVGTGWSRDACAVMLGKMDTDGDQYISPHEFRAFVSEVGLHGMRAEVDAFTVAGLSLRSGGGGGGGSGAADGEVSPSVRQLSAAMATLPSELPRHAHALRAQIATKRKEALLLKRADRKAEAVTLCRDTKPKPTLCTAPYLGYSLFASLGGALPGRQDPGASGLGTGS